MAKIKVDTTGVEVSPSAVKPGLYPVKIKEIEAKEAKSSGNMQLAVIYEISGGEFDGRVLFDYIPLNDDSMAFRLAAFQDALGLKRKGEIDTDKLVGKKLQVRTVVQKSEEYGEQARVRNVLPPKSAGKAEDDLDEDDDDDDEVDYEEMDLAELKEEVKARELEVDGKQTKKKLIAALEENDEEEEDDSDDDDDESDEAEADDDDESEDDDEESDDDEDEDEDDEDDEEEGYDDMDLPELKKLAKKRKVEVKGKVTKKKLVAALEEDDEADEQDYSEMDLDELKSECKERGLKTAGKKAQLITRLEKDDKTGDDGEPF